jgi:hypothetical protein
LTVTALVAALGMTTRASVTEAAKPRSIKLFPLLYRTESAEAKHLEALFGLVGSHTRGETYDRRVVPVFWGDDYLHVVPLYWKWGDNWLALPLGGEVNGKGMFGNVFWDEDSLFVFPFYWTGRGDWALIPLAWHAEGKTMIGPVFWSEDFFDVYPVFFSGRGNWALLPLAGKWNEGRAVGPVWWGKDYFHVIPLSWSWDDRWLLIPLWYHKDRTTWLPLLLGNTRPGPEGGREFNALLRLLHFETNPSGTSFELLPLLDVSGGREKHFSLLWRLFEYHSDESERYMRFLFMPWKLWHKER